MQILNEPSSPMHTRKKRPTQTNVQNKQELKSTPATSLQLMQILELEKEIKSLIQQINRPWSIALSALALPFIAQLLLLNKYSPFHRYYTSVQQSLYDRYFLEMRESVQKANEIGAEPIKRNYNQIMEDIDFRRDLFPNGNNLSPAEVVERHVLVNPGSEWIWRNNFIAIYESAWTLIHPISEMIKDSVLKTMPIPELIALANNTYQEIIYTDLPAINKMAERMYATEQTGLGLEIESNPWIILFKIPLAILIQTQGFDRMLQWGFPYGVWQNPAPQLPENQWLSELLAGNYLEKLIDHRDALKKSADFNVTTARILLVLFLPTIIAIFGAEIPPAFAIYLGISLISLALTNAKQELTQYYAHCTFNSALNKQLKLLETLKDEKGIIQINQYAGETLEQSHFFINFKTKGIGLSRGTLKNIIKHALIFNNINILAETSDGFYLAANITLDKAKLLCAKDLIDKNIKRQLAIQALKEQIKKLKDNKPDSITLYRPSHDADGFATAEIYFTLLPREKFLLEKLQEISNGKLSFDTSEGEDGCLYVRISGHDAFDDDLFKEVQSFQSRVYAALKQQFMATEIEPDNSTEVKSSDKAEKELRRAIATARAAAKAAAAKSSTATAQVSASPAPVVVARLTPPPVRVIRWSVGEFRSDDEKSQIHPIFVNERVQTEESVHRAHHFTLFRLHRSDFPDTTTFESAERIVNEPTITNRNIVFAKGFKRNTEGNWITVSAKARMKGKKGDIGLFAREEKSATGESLHIFEAVSFSRHSKSKS